MKLVHFQVGRINKIFIGLVFLVLACHLDQAAKKEHTLTLSKHLDSLSQYDSLIIEVKDSEGNLLAIVFEGKATRRSQLEKLIVPGWDGGPIRIVIKGFRKGSPTPIYQVEKSYDGTNRQTGPIQIQVHPDSRLSSSTRSIRIYEGQSVPLPRVDITPSILADQSLIWSSDNPRVVAVEDKNLVGVSTGSTRVTARLRQDTSKTVFFTLEVKPDPGPPTTLTLDRDTLRLIRNGPPGRFGLEVNPSTADTEVIWRLFDSTIADPRPDGSFEGRVIGLTQVWATSKRNPSALDSGWIEVSKPVAESKVVTIEEPKDNSYTNRRRIPVAWSVNGRPQNTLLTEDLATVGPNVIIRSANDSSGESHSASITVHLDTAAPNKPILSGASPTNAKPLWNWSTGGGGSGDFRIHLGSADFAADAPTTRDISFTLATEPVSGTTYTLFVQERDLAGNWSPVASLGILHDVTKPVVVIANPQASGIHYTSATGIILSGTASGPLPISHVTYRVATGSASNATYSAGSWSTPAIPLQEGMSLKVSVAAVDNAGNSGEAILDLFLDSTPPTAPTIISGPPAATTSFRGSFRWSPGGDATPGSGLNGRYRYNLNGGPWKDTTADLITDLPLIEGNNVFSVQEQDRAQNWSGPATRSVRVDTTPPLITLSSHSNPAASATTTITLSGQVRDTGSGVSTMAVSGQVSGSPVVTVTGTNWTTASLTLASGPNNLVFTATDQLGNSRVLNVGINVNLPASRVIITNPSDSLTLTRLDTIRVHYTIDGIPGNRLYDLVEGVNRLEIVSPANPSGNIGRDTIKVTRDAIPPRAPILTAGSSPTNGTATWTWTSRGDSANGAGVRNPAVFRYSINGGPFTETGFTQHQLATEGTFSLVVQEQDRAGNWSPSSAGRTIVVDKSGPAIVIQTRNNYVTNRSRVYVRYTVDGNQAGPYVCQLTKTDTANACTVSATDNLGNTTNASITVWYRPKTWFITQNGIGPGTSWDSASSDLPGLAGNDSMSFKELWVATGKYPVIGYAGFVKIVGGFDATSFPHNSGNRNLIGTFVDAVNIDTGFTADGLVFKNVLISNGGEGILNNVRISSPDGSSTGIGVFFGGSLVANNLQIIGESITGSIFYIEQSKAVFNGGAFVNNKADNPPLIASGSQVRFSNGFNFYGNSNSVDGTTQIVLSGDSQLIVDSDVNLDCSNIRNNGGSGTCKGNPIP